MCISRGCNLVTRKRQNQVQFISEVVDVLGVEVFDMQNIHHCLINILNTSIVFDRQNICQYLDNFLSIF